MYPSPYAGSGAGAGGKIRRRPPTRAASTPYERPPAAAAAHRLAAAAAAASASSGPGGEGGGGWVSRLVDPASRLIAGGAARLFGSVFRKRLAPPPAPSPQLSSPHGRNKDPTQDFPDSTNVDSPPLPEGGIDKGKNIAATSDDKALSEVEHLLMRKTFTRVEFDRLTDLLRARTIEPDPPTSIVSHKEKNEGIRIDGIGVSTSHQMAAESPTVKVHSHGARSPAELAKQYMSSRYSREPPSSSLRSRLFLENKGEASNNAYDKRPEPPIVQAPIEFGNENPGLPVNGYGNSGLRGRSAIYRMSRSPYFKGSSSGDVNTFSLSQRAQSSHIGGRQVLKRRGGDLENEVGSIGPIRRIRQKSNMMSPFRDARAISRGNLLTSRTSGSDFTEDSISIQESPSSKRLLLGTTSARPLESHKNGDTKPSDSAPSVPAQSNKMAEKIFEQLNIIAPSPKEKQSGLQSVTGNTSNSISKKPVLQDTGPSSMYDPSSSLKFQDLDGANGPLDPYLNGSLLKKDKLNMIEGGSSKVASSDKPTFLGNSVSASTSRKPGFKMAVIEDLPELDDDLEVPIPSKSLSSKVEVKTTEQKSDSTRKEQKVEQNILEQKVESNLMKNIVGSPVSELPVASLSKTVSSSGGLLSSNDPGKAVPNASVDNDAGFAFSNAPPGTRPATSVSAMPLASVNDDKQTGASNTSVGLKQSIAPDMQTPNVKNKSTFGQSVTKLTTLDSTSSDRGDKTEKAEDVIKSSDKMVPATASTALNAPLQFGSAASTSASLSNGFSNSSSPKLPTVPPAVSSAASTMFAASSSSPAISSSSSSPAFTAFNFSSSTSVGFSMVPSAKSDGTTAEVKPASTLSFGTGGAADEVKSTVPDSASKPSSKLLSSPISSSPITSVPAFSQVAASSDAAGIVTAALSNASTSPGVQAASTTPFTFPSSGNSLFGFSSPAQSTGLSTSSVTSSTSQPSAASTLFGSKPTQTEDKMQQPSQTPKPQFGSPFPSVTPGVGASSSGSGTFSFGIGASSTGSGTMSFGVGASSSTPGTSSAFGAAAPSSGPGIFSFGAGSSSTGSGTVPFGVGAASSGPGTVSFGPGAASSGPGTVSFGAGASSSGPGTVSFGAGASSSGPGTVSFGAGASSSGPGTVSFGATTSTSGSGFGNSPFGAGATFANPFNSSSGTGFTFSSASSSAGASTVASTSVFASTSAASSASTFSNPFGSSSSPPSTFTFGQSASSGSAFAFGVQPAPTFSSRPSVFSFTSANTSMNSSTSQPAFGMTNMNTAFGMGSPGNDQMNEDSMADDTNQPAPAPAPIFGSPFGQQNSTPAAPAFNAPAVQPGGAFQFGGQQQAAQQNPSFPAAGSLEFQGGNFSLGSGGGGGGDKSNRRMIKVKRAPKKR
ncbi:nuclear pore complex protein NUP1-like [Panicum miliaceum]|uniref:Nuclear pore complex protein NUP1-like n=1 Tax=Panicum miliaceum TaxID=4540 RepID=A0A3L6TI69_PANMI|nr:nuclear pore complex protein NUP1-like [Panicum miliaceum]